MALQDFFRKQPMDESLAPKRGDVEHSGGDSPSKKQKGGVTPPSVKPAESSPPANSGEEQRSRERRQQRTRTAQKPGQRRRHSVSQCHGPAIATA